MIKRMVFLVGILLCVFPFFSNAVARKTHQTIVETYQNQIDDLSDKQVEEDLEAAFQYNEKMAENKTQGDYRELLNPMGNGVMGSIEIPRIKLNLPIYHGTEDETLRKGIGHIDWSGLPVGGAGTHCLLAGHRGMPDAELFTRLHELEAGDLFYIKVYNRILIYKVCQIQTIKPEDTKMLAVWQDKDFVSLITCTPYGINTHRLVVTGERTKEIEGL